MNTMEATLMHRTLDTNGVSLHVATAGAEGAPLVMLLHGFPEYWGAWRQQVQPLVDAGWRVAVPDQRGYGESQKPEGTGAYTLDTLADDVMGIAQALNAPRFCLVGHDWGGMVAWHLAAREPAAVERLAILNAPHPATFFSYALTHPLQMLRSTYVGFFQLRWIPEALLRANNFALLQAALTHSSRPGTFGEDKLAGYRAAWAEPDALRAMLDWYRAMPLARPRAEKIEAPVRIVWGDADSALEPGLAQAALRYCRNGHVVRLPRASHWLHHEEPDEVNALLVEFLGDGRAAAAAATESRGKNPR
ncbi:pimeloyl-ACP methyl ester carboxylesterase [Variovorax sp. W1I1]|uniref:alpha/beta fold hydrolase n=1 Tax=Variovorax sp. W1I1 TaxID=3042309 RepID=UPI00278B78D5|nr:alpha/beta hydrolase [Variovorax sp. W1I1]MDQ0607433.1 pimeloyl-ACP methyl ester carboxylesterase [Variovorax sp. W1I1]